MILDTIQQISRIAKQAEHAHRQNIKNELPKRPPASFLSHMDRLFRYYLAWLVQFPGLLFTQPIDAIVTAVGYPIIAFGLLMIRCLFWIGELANLADLIAHWKTKHGRGLDIVNWSTSDLFGVGHRDIIEKGIQQLSCAQNSNCHSFVQLQDIKEPEAKFEPSLPIAMLFSIMSALVYERDISSVQDAIRKYQKYGRPRRDSQSSEYTRPNTPPSPTPSVSPSTATPAQPPSPLLRAINCLYSPSTASNATPSVDEVNDELNQSEEFIQKWANRFGMDFRAVNELNSIDGPFCGLFWSVRHKFIVVVFKGTTPTDLSEWLVDCSLQRVNADPFLQGQVHQGFYRKLFGQPELSNARNAACPYKSIIRTLRYIARNIVEDTLSPITEKPFSNSESDGSQNPRVNVWVTGHSLGAALASLFYARLLMNRTDLYDPKVSIVLQDGYVFGCPAVGDYELASAFHRATQRPITQSNCLWRIIHDDDMVYRVPYGISDGYAVAHITRFSVLNYFHLGIPYVVKLKKTLCKEHPLIHVTPTSIKDILRSVGHVAMHFWSWRSGRKTYFTKSTSQDEFSKINPISAFEKCFPKFVRDHFPNRYFYALKQLWESNSV